MDPFENHMYGAKNLATETRKSFPTHYGLWEKIFKSVFKQIYRAIKNEILFRHNLSFWYKKCIISIQNVLNNINILHTNTHKDIPICFKLSLEPAVNIFNCISRLLSIMLNFNALSDEYAIQRFYTVLLIQSYYAVLLKSSRIFYLILGIIFRNYLIMVSIEVEVYLWHHFV